MMCKQVVLSPKNPMYCTCTYRIICDPMMKMLVSVIEILAMLFRPHLNFTERKWIWILGVTMTCKYLHI